MLNSDCGCVILQVTWSAVWDQARAAEVASNRTLHKYREVRIVYRSGMSLVAPDFYEAFDILLRI